MRRAHWIIFGAIVIAVVIVGLLVLAFFPGLGWGRMGYYGWRGSMMGGWCPWCPWYGSGWLVSPIGMILGVISMIVMTLIPLGILALLVAGGIWLVRSTGIAFGQGKLPCPNCGSGVQPGWKVCPYCGGKLEV